MTAVPLTQGVLATLQYVKRFNGETILIKLGGAALQSPELVDSLCEDLALIRSVGVSLVLVHGGGPSINRELEAHGIKWEFHNGQRITTDDMVDIVEMVLCGQVNRRIVRTLNHAGVKAVGIAGSDARTLQCKAADPKLGQVGLIEKVDESYIKTILQTQSLAGEGYLPVVAPIGFNNKDGKAFNVNADWAAGHLAQALGIKKVMFLTDQNGILDGEGNLLSELDAGELENLIETETVKGGMLIKAKAVLAALRGGVQDVHILNGQRPHGLIEELFTDQGIGTVLRSRSRAARKTKGKNHAHV